MTFAFVLMVSIALVFVGLLGVLRHQKDLMRFLMSLQFILLGALFNFTLGADLQQRPEGFVFSLFIICLTGIQITASLAIFVLYFRKHTHLFSDDTER